MLKRLVLFLIISGIAFSQEISLDDIIFKIESDKNDYIYTSYINSQKMNDILIRDDKLGSFNGVNISSNFNWTENKNVDRIHKFERTNQNKVSYGPFFVNLNYTNNKNQYISYGIEKNLKDLFYSKDKNSLEKNMIKKDLNLLTYNKNLKRKKVDFINYYLSLLNLSNEEIIKRKALNFYQEEVKKLKKSYELGAIPKISLDAAILESEDAELQLELISTKKSNLYEAIRKKFNLSLNESKLKDIYLRENNIESYLTSYMKDEIEELKLNLKIAENREQYSKYESFMPDIIVSYERVDRNRSYNTYINEQDIFSLRFSKKLFSTDTDYKLAQLETEKNKEELVEKIKQLEIEKLNIENQFKELEKTMSITSKKYEIASKKYLIRKKEYELGKISYLDVIEAYNSFLNQELDMKNSRNKFYAFIYEVIIKSQ